MKNTNENRKSCSEIDLNCAETHEPELDQFVFIPICHSKVDSSMVFFPYCNEFRRLWFHFSLVCTSISLQQFNVASVDSAILLSHFRKSKANYITTATQKQVQTTEICPINRLHQT